MYFPPLRMHQDTYIAPLEMTFAPLPAYNLSSGRSQAEHRNKTDNSSSPVMQVPLIRLQCGVNSYDWGKVGNDSAAAKFAAATPSGFSIQEEKPYAEVRICGSFFS